MNEVEKILNELKADNSIFYKKDPVYGRFTVFSEINGIKTIIKIVRKDDSKNYFRAKEEAAAGKILGQFATKQKSLDSGESENFFWFTRRFINGKAMAEQLNGKPNYDLISDKYLDVQKVILPQLIKFVQTLRQSRMDLLNKEFHVMRFEKDISNYDIKKIEQQLEFSLDQIGIFYHNNLTNFLKPKKMALCMGDLVPSNVIIGEGNKIEVVDFEWFGVDNCISDVSFLWLHLWRYPNWRRDLLQSFIADADDLLDFKMSIIRQILGLWADASHYRIHDNEKNVFKKECLKLILKSDLEKI